MDNPFLKRLMKDKKEDVVHSSAYAKAQNSKGVGAASTESFAERKKMEQNRSVIRGYRDSKIVSEIGRRLPRTNKDGADANRDYSSQVDGGGADDARGRALETARFGADRSLAQEKKYGMGRDGKMGANKAGMNNGRGFGVREGLSGNRPIGESQRRSGSPPARRNTGISR